jgi:hypothetical protein
MKKKKVIYLKKLIFKKNLKLIILKKELENLKISISNNIFNNFKSYDYFKYTYPEIFLNEEEKKKEGYKEGEDLILEKQKKYFGWKKLIAHFPCSTQKILKINPYFCKKIKGALQEYKINKLELPCNVTNNYQTETTGNKTKIIIQSRGVGKSHEALSHAVTDNNPTVYFDLSIQNEKFKESFLNDCLEIALNNRNEKEVYHSFFLYYACRLLLFINWYYTEKIIMKIEPKKIEFSDFLRISMINNNEGESYDKKSLIVIRKTVQNYNFQNLYSLIFLEIENISKETNKPFFIIFDEGPDMRKLKNDEYNFFKHRNGEDNEKHNIYHVFITTTSDLKEILTFIQPIEIYGTLLAHSGILKGKYSSFKLWEVILLFINNLIGPKQLIEYFDQYFIITDDEKKNFLKFFKMSKIKPRPILFFFIVNKFFKKDELKNYCEIKDDIEPIDIILDEKYFKIISNLILNNYFLLSYDLSSLKDFQLKILLNIYLSSINISDKTFDNYKHIIDSFYRRCTAIGEKYNNDAIYELVDFGFLNFEELKENKICYFAEPFLYRVIESQLVSIIKNNNLNNNNLNNNNLNNNININNLNNNIEINNNLNNNNINNNINKNFNTENFKLEEKKMNNFNYLLNLLIIDYLKEIENSKRGFIWEDIIHYLLKFLSKYFNENKISYKNFPLFNNFLEEFKKRNINLDDYYIDIKYFKTIDLSVENLHKSISNSFAISPKDRHGGGADEIFTFYHKSNENKNILVLIQEKDDYSKMDLNDAVRSVWCSPLFRIKLNDKKFTILNENEKIEKTDKYDKSDELKENEKKRLSEEDFKQFGNATWIEKRDGLKKEINKFENVISIVISWDLQYNSQNRSIFIPSKCFDLDKNNKGLLLLIQKKEFLNDIIKLINNDDTTYILNKIIKKKENDEKNK